MFRRPDTPDSLSVSRNANQFRSGNQVARVDREQEKEGDSIPLYNSFSALSIQQQRVRLPIYHSRKSLLWLIENTQVTVIVGETGSGKTTQIPQYLDESGWTLGKNGEKRIVGCTQPRRVAATSVAARVAEEMGVELGREVGYSIRFDETCSEVTRIKYLTDGMLLREMMLDPLLTSYSVIMIDEAHERSLHTDIILGLLKKILARRQDLRLIISSATIDAENIRDFFNDNVTSDETLDTCRILSIEGRTFPVDIHYLFSPIQDYLQQSIQTILQIHRTQPPGDVLVFLTGQEEIDQVVSQLKEMGDDRLRVLPMYSGIPADRINLVFEQTPPRTRKVVVATNIAETSITIDGIIYVVDCGFAKVRVYDPLLAIETLQVQSISQATAKQRAGRAGRNQPGKCYRLFTEEAYLKLSPSPIPEMQRTNLSTVVLQLKALGIDNIIHFDFLTPPPPENMVRALEVLYSLGAIDDQGQLTDPVGTTMAEFPIDPFLAKMLLSSGQIYGCSEEILSIASLLSVQTIWSFTQEQRNNADSMRRRFSVYEGDHLTLLNVYNSFLQSGKNKDWCKSHFINYRAMMRAMDIRNQLKKYLNRWRIPIRSTTEESNIRKSILSGYFANVARAQPDGSYKTLRSDLKLNIHPISSLNNQTPEWVVFHEVVQTNKVYIREVTVIEPIWLAQIAPHFYDVNRKK